MANFYGMERSNHFRVKDVEAFEDAMPCDVTVNEDGTVVLLPGYSDDGMLSRYCEEADEDIDLADVIKEHIAEDSVCVVMGAGSEKQRYCAGWAFAVTHDEVIGINLNDIYKVVKDKHPDKECPSAEY